MERMPPFALAILLMACAGLVPSQAAAPQDASAALWEEVEKAYRQENNLEQGHQLLNRFIAEHPGETGGVPEALLRISAEDCFEIINRTWRDFAMRNWMAPHLPDGMKGVCGLMLEMIREELKQFLVHPALLPERAEENKAMVVMRQAFERGRWHGRPAGSQDRSDLFHGWSDRSVKRLLALARAGIISERDPALVDATTILLYARLRQGRYHEAAAVFDTIVTASDHDPVWLFARARFHHWMASPRAGKLFQELFHILNHPQADTRLRALRQQAQPYEAYQRADLGAGAGTWLSQMLPEDANETWARVERGDLGGVEVDIDALMGEALAEEAMLLRKDGQGGAEAWQVLNARLRSLPEASLKGLRLVQDRKCRADMRSGDLDRNTDAELKALFRRHPWSRTAQQGLLVLGRRYLEAGRGQFARRSFNELLAYSDDVEMRALARVGRWVTLAQAGDSRALVAAFEQVEDGKKYPWMGGEATAGDIRRRLMKGMEDPGLPPAPAFAIRSLSELQAQVVNIPAGLLWPGTKTESDAGLGWLSMQFRARKLLVASQNFLGWYDLRDTRMPAWTLEGPARSGGGSYRAGEFRPVIDKGRIYTRYSYGPMPTHIARLDAASGAIEWGTKTHPPGGGREGAFPIGDPLLSEGLVYCLGWEKGRSGGVMLECMDAESGLTIWQNRMNKVSGFHPGDHNKIREVAFGNSVTIHDGAIYASPNWGMVTRNDIRDGRLEWSYEYESADWSRQHAGGWGASPIVFGDYVICLPRDGNAIFALDRRTGRLIWKNALVVPEFALGLFEDQLMVLGNSMLASLDGATGRITWTLPLTERNVGRPKLIGSSAYLGSPSGLSRIDVQVGIVQEKMAWPDRHSVVRNFAIHEKKLYLVTDEPCREGLAYKVGEALDTREGTQAKDVNFPLRQAWKLPRSKPVLHVPPRDSAFRHLVLSWSNNILECIDTRGRSSIAWQKFMGSRPYRVLFHEGNAVLFYRPWHDRIQAVAFDMETGRMEWTSREIIGLHEVQKRFGSSVMLSERNRLGALDLGTGRILWDRIINTYGIGYGPFSMVGQSADGLHLMHSLERGRVINWLVTDPATGIRTGDPKKLEAPGMQGAEGLWLRGAQFGTKHVFVSVYKRMSTGNRQMVYQCDIEDRSVKLLREDVSVHTLASPYILLRGEAQERDKKRETTVLREDDPAFERRFGFSTDRTLLVDDVLIKVDDKRKGFRVIDLETGVDRLVHEEDGEATVVTFEVDDYGRLYLVSHDRRMNRFRLSLFDRDTWTLQGVQELLDYRLSGWNDRWKGDQRYRPAEHGVWMTRTEGQLLLVGDDGITAYVSGDE